MGFVHDHNRRAWDRMAVNGQRFTRAAPDEDFHDPLSQLDSRGWLPADLTGLKVLCLACGGGKHGPLFAAAGAEATVVDISPEQLALDRQVAAERGLSLRTVEASMDDLSALPAGYFEIVCQPVSTCYVPDVAAVYRQVARVLQTGGVYVSQHKQPASLQADLWPSRRGYELVEPYYRDQPLPPTSGSLLREEGTLEFVHRWEQLLGELCRAGFVIEDVGEPLHARADAEAGSWGHRSQYLPPYIRIKARRVGQAANSASTSRVWLPD